MQKALEALVMERQTEGKAAFPPFAQRLIDRGFRDGKRETLLRLAARAGIELAEEDRARILACEETEVLERWIENVLGARTAADVFS